MPAEWEHQSMVQLTWPHKDTDWAPILPEITAVYEEMAREISKRENLLIVAPQDVYKCGGSKFSLRECGVAFFTLHSSLPTTLGLATTASSPLKNEMKEMKGMKEMRNVN